MPRGRPKSTTTAQKSLSFGPTPNKVTKPSIPPPSSNKLSKTASPSLEKAIVTEFSTPEPESQTTAEEERKSATLAIRNVAPASQSKGSEIEERAAKVPDTQIRKYWKEKEDERIAPRVHQQGLSVNEKVLRHFDLSSQYGPCIGIPRMKRWKRANGLKLQPPIEVLAVLMKEEKNKNTVAERAFMDGLLTSRLAVNE